MKARKIPRDPYIIAGVVVLVFVAGIYGANKISDISITGFATQKQVGELAIMKDSKITNDMSNSKLTSSEDASNSLDNQFDSSETVRLLIEPADAQSAERIRKVVEVQHDFNGKFTAEVPKRLVSQIKNLAKISEIERLKIPNPRDNARAGKGPASNTRLCTPNSQKPWGVTKVNGGLSGYGSGVVVTVLDTGASKHIDLSPKLCKDTTKRGIRDGCNDQNGHGTHVAGIIAATGSPDGLGIYGVAPAASLWAIKVCGTDGTCWSDDIAEAIYYATDLGTNIISMSFGADSESSLIRDAIDYAAARNVLLVAAAGNDGPADGTIDYPGANVRVIAVGATNQNDGIASFSSRGINYQTTPYVVEEKDIEFAAPGVQIESTWNDGCYRILSGTSMATPHVSGIAAASWQGTAAATRDYLQFQARYNYADIGRAGDDPDAGFGLPRVG